MELIIPTKWDDVTIEMYIKLRPVLEVEQDPVTKAINMLTVLTDKKRKDIMNLTIPQYYKVLEKMKFLETEIPTKLNAKRFKVGKENYEFMLDAKEMLFGEYVSIMEIMQKASEDEGIMFDNLHKILTVICRPVEKKWFKWKPVKMDNSLIYKTQDNLLKNMSISLAYPIAFFFYTRYPSLMQTIKTFLVQEAVVKMKEAKTLLVDGDGSA